MSVRVLPTTIMALGNSQCYIIQAFCCCLDGGDVRDESLGPYASQVLYN